MRKSNYLCSLSYDYRTLFLQSFDTNFSSLELSVTDISAVLLVYILVCKCFSSIALVLLNIRETIKTFYLYTLYMVIEYCHSNHLIPISAV